MEDGAEIAIQSVPRLPGNHAGNRLAPPCRTHEALPNPAETRAIMPLLAVSLNSAHLSKRLNFCVLLKPQKQRKMLAAGEIVVKWTALLP